ncbi:hypothetical protein NMK71_06090 [Weeksellaceae bacterium KMM 9713]|uniref:Uncharacterized protein n=1 Tax=Profundicola chukchiensis TaxID=2961959 RepID=A0A9X4MZQ4_9FLAO|nr:hypothetical protein [Profundicola chukchiensis]MDG4945977.1 hypothetical protein [Profundicola chukchiensis]MDG4951165.1 hypothetical protein [Profundicola chukchiensis]
MTKITFKNIQLYLFSFLAVVAFLFITYHFLNGRIFRLGFSIDKANEIGLSLLVFSLICRHLSHNFIKYDHDHLALKINKIKSREFSFSSIQEYKIDDNKLKISFRDESEEKFNLMFLDEKDIKRLDAILDIHIHEFLHTS